jgi:hypothetical protein
MPEELFSTEIQEIKALELQSSQLTTDRDAKAAKAEQLNGEVFAMRQRRDELEKIIKNASMLLLEGKLSEDEYGANRQELSMLYQNIDTKDEIFNVFDC